MKNITNTKYLGICILVAAIIITGGLIYHANKTAKLGRYQAHQSNPPGMIFTIDTITGEITSKNRTDVRMKK